jgi:hypothetical protein
MLLRGRLLTRASFDKQLDPLRAADSAQVELHKQQAQDWKEAAHKSETARHEIINQNKLLLEGQRTTNNLMESLGGVIHRKEVDNEIVWKVNQS